MGRARTRPSTLPAYDRATAWVQLDAAARRLIAAQRDGECLHARFAGSAAPDGLPLQVSPSAAAGAVLMVFGEPGWVLQAHCTAVPYAVAAVLLACGETTGRRIRCDFAWPPGMARSTMAVVGFGAAARVRALVHDAEPDPRRWPVIYLKDRSA